MQKLILVSLVVGIVAALVMHLPIIGLLFALVAAPVMLVAPELGATGAHVELGFAWISLKSPFAWIAFVGYFSFLSGLVLWVCRQLKTKRMQK